jgi:hypothetical protein
MMQKLGKPFVLLSYWWTEISIHKPDHIVPWLDSISFLLVQLIIVEFNVWYKLDQAFCRAVPYKKPSGFCVHHY